LIIVTDQNGKIGCIDYEGNVVISCQWTSCELLDHAVIVAKTSNKQTKYGLLDYSGKVLYQNGYDRIQYTQGYYTLLKNNMWSVAPKNIVQTE